MLSRTRSKKPSSGTPPPASRRSRRVLMHPSGAVGAMPETFVGTPAVIALDDLLLGRLLALVERDVPAEPQHRDPVRDREDVVQVVRDEHDGEPLLGEARRRARAPARSARRRARRSARRGSRAASSTSPRARRRPTGAGRRRGSRPAGGSSGSSSRRGSSSSRPSSPPSPAPSAAGTVVRLAAEVHVLDDVEVVAEREVLVDDLDPELGGVLRPVDRGPACRRRGSRRSSGEWIPATHLISVDLPAPLSPTSAITSPARTSKSTSVSA